MYTGAVDLLYQSKNGAACGVPTYCSRSDRYVFILGPENPTADWSYCAWHRCGAVGSDGRPELTAVLDARDLISPYTAGALRGGTHLHTFSPSGRFVASTYEDHLLAAAPSGTAHSNRRLIAVSVLGQPVRVPKGHARNQDGISYTVVVTDVKEHPRPGSDEIARAYSEAWLDDNRIAFQADVCGSKGSIHSELFIVSLPADLCIAGDHPLQGTQSTRPGIPRGTHTTRITYTDDDVHPGLSGPRHWAVPSPDGQWIGCFRHDRQGHSQFHVVGVSDGAIHRITDHDFSATSAFTWHPNGQSVAYVADGSVFQVPVSRAEPIRLTPKVSKQDGPRHHACVFSPDGNKIAFMKPVASERGTHDQLFCVEPAIDVA